MSRVWKKQSQISVHTMANNSPPTSTNTNPNIKDDKPLSIGVFGGSFNPIHLGHTLLAVTVQQTKCVDKVVLVPVYKHAAKRNLLEFQHRVNMCQRAVSSLAPDTVVVSTVEQRVGASNGTMLRGLKQDYPDARLYWICGDDFFRWMHKPKGLETLAEVEGIIVQRRLHRNQDTGTFFQEETDLEQVMKVTRSMNVTVDFIYGELPHFSSTLVRNAPGNWRAFLTQKVAQYLDEHPQLLQSLLDDLQSDTTIDETSPPDTNRAATVAVVLRGLEAVHALQYERGVTGLRLSQCHATSKELLRQAQQQTDQILKELHKSIDLDTIELHETRSLALELQRISVWLGEDRAILKAVADDTLAQKPGLDGWLSRLTMVQKFNPRIDVLIAATIRALTEVTNFDIAELIYKWCEGKENLGRLRAFVCAGGPKVPTMIQAHLKLRERLCDLIDAKNRAIEKVKRLEAGFSQPLSAPGALHNLLERVTLLEYKILGCFAPSTPLNTIHTVLARPSLDEFTVEAYFEASTAALDFLLSFAKALTASACAASK